MLQSNFLWNTDGIYSFIYKRFFEIYKKVPFFLNIPCFGKKQYELNLILIVANKFKWESKVCMASSCHDFDNTVNFNDNDVIQIKGCEF